MKTALRISILVNILLLVWLGMSRNELQRAPVAEKTSSKNITPASPPSASPPFRWGRLESTNYPTYIQNLRDIGCPDQTVRDIVTADVENLYRSRREALRRQHANKPQAEQTLQTWLAELDDEELAVIAELLGKPRGDENVQNNLANTSITLPLVWQDVDVSNLNLEPGQLAAIDSLRNTFVQQIGGTNQNPRDPEYLERWQKAQPAIDDAVAGMIGRQAYMELQIRAGAASN